MYKRQVETRLSKANRGRLQHILRTWDAWIESKGQAPLWESTTIKTPVKKMSKAAMATLAAAKAASSTEKSTDEASSVGSDRMRPGEYQRLIAIVFSDENWPRVCGSEQGSNDRLDGRGESNLLGDRYPIFAKIAKDFINPDWTNDGVPPRTPKTTPTPRRLTSTRTVNWTDSGKRSLASTKMRTGNQHSGNPLGICLVLYLVYN